MLIEEFLSRPIPSDWHDRSIEERRLFWSGAFDDEEQPAELEERLSVCAIEIWCECFNGDPKQYTQAQAREINNMLKGLDGWEYRAGISAGKVYGRQRGYARKGSELLE